MVPRDCCAAHRPAEAHETPHCERTAPVPHCPMRAADGTPCPMHRTAAPHDAHGAADPHAAHRAPESDDDGCAMSGACGGPFAGLTAVLSQHAVLSARIAVPADLTTTLGAPARCRGSPVAAHASRSPSTSRLT